MVGTTLTQDMVDDGERLIEKLDANDIGLTSAFWFYFSELDEWRLVLDIPSLQAKGPKCAYTEVRKALVKLDPPPKGLVFGDVMIAMRDAPMVKLLRSFIQVEGISQIRATNNVINGRLIDDALIYRMR